MQQPSGDHKVLFLASTDGAQTGRSGYNIFSEYVPNSIFLEAYRKPSNNFIQRLTDAIAARISLSRWARSSSLKLEFKAFSILRKQKIDIVHYLWGDRDIGFMDFFKKRNNLKLVISLHNCASMQDDSYNFPGRFKNFDALILMSKVQQPYFEKAGIPPEKIHILHHGIDCNYFKPRPQLKDENVFTVLTVGSWLRNFTILSEICKQLGEASNVKIRVISSQQYKPLFEGQPHVTFQSRVSNEELLRAYQQASCFLMTAEDATANNALLEALACGLPIVTERVGGIPEYVNDKCAVFCEDVNSFVENIIKISASPQLQKEMGLAARQRAEQLDWRKSAKQLREIYDIL